MNFFKILNDLTYPDNFQSMIFRRPENLSQDFQDLGDIRILSRDLGPKNFNHGGDLALCPRLGRLQGIHGQLQGNVGCISHVLF